jgi:hypothetical protein
MANILICGDSWGCGEWNVTCTEVTHPGLEQYLINDGHTVFNISKGGCSNLDIFHRLKIWFERFGDQTVDLVLVFQTEYTRDFKHSIDTDWNIQQFSDLASCWIERFYMRLAELAQDQRCAIKIIGGCSDSMWFDHMPTDYPGCEIVCQSMTNLLVNGDHRIEEPVFSWFTKNTEGLVTTARQKGIDIKNILTMIDQGFEREALLKANPELFFPDGKHPNRQAHGLLYDFLLHKSIIPH